MLSRDRISRLAALSLLLSAIELFVPRILPFFRLGLANIPLLMGLSLDPASFAVLCLLKGIGTSYTAGNLFSVFALISIAQSLAAGTVMYFLYRFAGKAVTIWGISISGALVSTLIQLFLASLYAGKGTMAFLPLMLLLSLPSSLITAWLSTRIPEPVIQVPESSGQQSNHISVILLAISGAAMMMTDRLQLLIPSVLAAFMLQHLAHRRIKLLPHLTLLLFMLVSSLLVPHGAVVFRIFSFPVTEGSIIDGFSKALRLSGGIAISQAFSGMIVPGKGLIGETLSMFTALLTAFRNTEGRLWPRFMETLKTEDLYFAQKPLVNIPAFTLFAFTLLFSAFAFIDCVFF